MTRKYIKWTQEETDFLINNAVKLTVDELSAHIGRGPSAIKDKATKLRIKLSNKYWTKEEEEFLLNSWGNKTLKYMSSKLNRNHSAIKQKASELHLGKRMHNTYNITMHKLIVALGISGNGGYATEKLIKAGIPYTYYRTENEKTRMVDIKEFWIWAEQNKKILNFNNFKKGLLGAEPEWVDIKRKADALSPSKKAHNNPWTPEQDSLLISKCKSNKYTYADLSKDLNRTQCAIKRRLYDLKVPYRPLPLNNQIKWTAEENRKMVEMYEMGFTAYAIALKLNKTELSICDRLNLHYAGKLKERNPKPWLEKDIQFLKDNWTKMYVDDIAGALGRSYYSIKQKAYNLKLGNSILGKCNKEVA